MNEIQHVSRRHTLDVAGDSNGHKLPAERLPAVEIPGAGLKRDYAGLLEYWQMIRRHKVAVVLITLLGGVVGFLITVPSPRIYQARTTLEVQGINENFLNMSSTSPTMSDATNAYPDYDIQTQVRILQSRTLIRKVVEDLEKNKRTDFLQPADRLSAWRKALRLSVPTPDQSWQEAGGTAAGNVQVRSSGTNRIVEVSTDSTSPQLAALFVNTLSKEYIEENLQARWESSEHTGEVADQAAPGFENQAGESRRRDAGIRQGDGLGLHGRKGQRRRFEACGFAEGTVGRDGGSRFQAVTLRDGRRQSH